MPIDKAWLRQRYLIDRAPIADIAAEANRSTSTIHLWLRAADIPLRGKHDAIHPRRRLTRRWLKTRLSAGLTHHAIAAEAGIDHSALRWQLAKLGLLDLRDDERERAALAAEHYRHGMPLREIADTMGIGRKTVTLWLMALGVRVHPPGRRHSDG